jgi:hypothetical protein
MSKRIQNRQRGGKEGRACNVQVILIENTKYYRRDTRHIAMSRYIIKNIIR